MKNKFQASLLTKTLSIRLFLFLMKVAGQVPCWFHEWRTPKCTPRLGLSTRCFLRAAEETFTQRNIEYGLSENFSFDFKFNVPVGF